MTSEDQLNLYAAFRSNFPELETVLLTTDNGFSYTYQDAEHCSAQIANYLTEMGLKRGDRVSAQVSKSPQALWLYLAVVRAGMVFHPLNTAYTDEELQFFSARCCTRHAGV
jgi:malonyl-CoA/methylmalonyl-CoA synthetase